MNEADRQALQNLPDKITVYRGYVPRQNKNGLSYSLDRSKAEWFAKRFADNGKVIVKKVEKTDIFALLTDRNEDEVILTPYATS